MAAPHLAGIVAQLFEADPSATPAEIEVVGGHPASHDKGTGLVDVVVAVARLTGG
jgi:hypothetical protein